VSNGSGSVVFLQISVNPIKIALNRKTPCTLCNPYNTEKNAPNGLKMRFMGIASLQTALPCKPQTALPQWVDQLVGNQTKNQPTNPCDKTK
jgi:hypothetical protein